VDGPLPLHITRVEGDAEQAALVGRLLIARRGKLPTPEVRGLTAIGANCIRSAHKRKTLQRSILRNSATRFTHRAIARGRLFLLLPGMRPLASRCASKLLVCTDLV
jgi:hypothetical protein